MDSIRALFSEKEKELSLAVAKVEALTRQLEDLRKDRRGPLNLITGLVVGGAGAANGNGGQKSGGVSNGNNGNNANSPTAKELDKLRRELMVRKDSYFIAAVRLTFYLPPPPPPLPPSVP